MFLILGIVNSIFIPSAVYSLWSQNNFFSFLENPLSYARKTHTRNKFILYFLVGTFLEGLFIILLFHSFNQLQSKTLILMTILGLILSALIGLTAHPKTRRFHKISAISFILVMILWSLIFHILLLSVSQIHGQLGLGLSLATIVGMSYFYFKLKSIGYSELYFIAIITMWNILMCSLYFLYF